MKDLRKKIIKRIGIYGLIVCAVSAFIRWQFSVGVIIGAVTSSVNLLLLERQIETLVNNKKGLFLAAFGYIIRFLFMGAVLFLTIKVSLAMFLGCSVGLLLVRIAIVGINAAGPDVAVRKISE